MAGDRLADPAVERGGCRAGKLAGFAKVVCRLAPWCAGWRRGVPAGELACLLTS